MKHNPNSMNAAPGIAGSVMMGSALANGMQGTDKLLTQDLADDLARQSAFDNIKGFYAYTFVLILMGFGAAWVIDAMERDALPAIVADFSPIWAPVAMFLPFAFGLAFLAQYKHHISAKMRARVYQPTDDMWFKSGGQGAFISLIQMALYTVVMVPLFIIQDAFELLLTVLSAGKHKFRTSEARYYEKQRLHYNIIKAQYGVEKAEKFLMKSSEGMHVGDDVELTYSKWMHGGYRHFIIGSLESRFGALGGGSKKGPTKSAISTPNKIVAKKTEGIKVKPIKPL